MLTKYFEIFYMARRDLNAQVLSVLLEKWKLASLVRGRAFSTFLGGELITDKLIGYRGM